MRRIFLVECCTIADAKMLESIAKFVMHDIVRRTSPTTIANTMTSGLRKIDAENVERYLLGRECSILRKE